jgi:hypothetical protein
MLQLLELNSISNKIAISAVITASCATNILIKKKRKPKFAPLNLKRDFFSEPKDPKVAMPRC